VSVRANAKLKEARDLRRNATLPEQNLVVELDGWTHSTPQEIAYDAKRTAFLNSEGYRVYRIGNNDVMESTEGVLNSILVELKK
jgi:very-short-patch-repair endonuclease